MVQCVFTAGHCPVAVLRVVFLPGMERFSPVLVKGVNYWHWFVLFRVEGPRSVQVERHGHFPTSDVELGRFSV